MRLKQHISPKAHNNHGFSLVELIISIAILAVIMIPLMSNFFRSAQMNKKAEELQVKSNIAADIMEGLKTVPETDILMQFSPAGSFDILDQSVEEVWRLLKITGGYEKYSTLLPMEEQPTYYFAINGIGGTAYDAVITMDSTPYNTITNTMNDYPMPGVINLDEKVNGLLFSMGKTNTDTTDSDALNVFLTRGQAYEMKVYKASAAYLLYLDKLDTWEDQVEEHAIGGPIPSPEPTLPTFVSNPIYSDSAVIKSKITKTMKITVNQKNIEYEIDYNCAWTDGDIEKTIQYPVSGKQYPGNVENVYLFYEPSQYAATQMDLIEVMNEDTSLPINFHVAKQGATTVGPPNQILKIIRDNELDNIGVYTNLLIEEAKVETAGGPPTDIPGLVKGKKEDRIYDITVNIYEYVPGDISNKYKNILYTLKSTKEE